MGDNNVFIPPRWLRGMYAQTILASSRIRTLGRNPILDVSREVILDAGDGVRLQGFFSPQVHQDPKGLVILLHGWEGSASSTYILHTGRYLYEHGYAVFRLNLRDHGQTHHLNEGMFYGTLLDEVFYSIKHAAELSDGRAVFLAGFSLGGNFALRIARKASDEPIDNLRGVMAISPALDPSKSTDKIDGNPLLRWYFLRKWKRSLMIKQELYPGLYDFSDVVMLDSTRAMTDILVARYGTYRDSNEYFRGYTLGADFFKDVRVPLTIVISRDDPVIPVSDFYRLQLSRNTDLVVHDYGGHNGFVYGVASATWYERRMSELFERLQEDSSKEMMC